MLLKIGELARLTGLTIRTLHHYDSIGLLSPSARTQAGYRLYQHSDMDRLHRIMALRKFGLSLADIANALAGPDLPLSAIVAQQIAMLDRQIAQASTLRARLRSLQSQLAQGQAPELAEWFTTMELMTMYDKYFSPEELQQIPLLSDAAVEQEWKELVARVRAVKDAGAGPGDTRAQAVATEWMVKLVHDTGTHPGLFARLNSMHEQEPSMQATTSIDGDLMQFIIAAFNTSRIALYKPFLNEQEYAHLAANYGKRSGEWPALIAAVRAAIDARTPPTDPAVLQLARQWLDLFRSYAGTDPATQLKFRQAHQQEPRLKEGSFVDAAMLQYLGEAMAVVAQEGPA
ncbi:MerR family transcriptional regulator [Janthinobacterium sp.]|uniref:MerR family transcriptional regulator n=1 Tax=Janthinobacterium sp. TaxID=1871054 RepID=UPI0025833AE4|nr:MerR family transcriptional regulator [Janthinobacterium sp.]MCX7293705.1 MerR family transcriptional regulator [Janthinobacterium sp.]